MSPQIKYLLIIITSSLLIVACKSNKTAHIPNTTIAIKIDNSTPEKLLREIWRYAIMADTIFNGNASSIHHNIFSDGFKREKPLTEIFRGDGSCLYDVIMFNVIVDAKIDSIKNQNNSSTTIYSKELYSKSKNKKIKLKYDFIKEYNGWFIDDLSQQCGLCDGSGKVQDIETEQKATIVCPAYIGTGWISIRYVKPLSRKWSMYAERKHNL